MSSLDHACDAVDLVTAAVSAVRFVEHSVFVEDLIDRCAPTHGVDLTEHVVELAKQQGRYSWDTILLQLLSSSGLENRC